MSQSDVGTLEAVAMARPPDSATISAKASSSITSKKSQNPAKKKKKKIQPTKATTTPSTNRRSNNNNGYDPKTYLFIFGAKYDPAHKTTIQIADEILNTILKLKFRASQIIQWRQSRSRNQQETATASTEPAPTGHVPIVAVLPSHGCVQEVILAGPQFKKIVKENLDYRKAYESVYFEEFLTSQELPLKRAVVQRVKGINEKLSAAGVQMGSQLWGQLKAKILSKSSYKHMGLQFQGKLSDNGTKILWTSFDILIKSDSQKHSKTPPAPPQAHQKNDGQNDDSADKVETQPPTPRAP